ncbi:hypothetical protein [Streptomyces sp. NPDC056244]|uniref:hypothetical protein n=1 Tax=Streptomyces sp. NPDC056244 TaxID=3345762 RepID=UPI0035E38DF1
MDEEAKRAEFDRRSEAEGAVYREMIAVVGEVAQASASLELQLRQLMATLLDSKYARLVAAGLGVSELIDTCTALMKVNQEVTEDARSEGLSLLAGLKDVINTRNQLVHGLIATHSPGRHEADEPVVQTVALVSKRRKPEAMVFITKSEAEETTRKLHDRSSGILHWAVTYLPGPLRRDQVTA